MVKKCLSSHQSCSCNTHKKQKGKKSANVHKTILCTCSQSPETIFIGFYRVFHSTLYFRHFYIFEIFWH
jgi:hypothetical protein